MKLKRAYLIRTLQIGNYTLRSLDGGPTGPLGWSLHLHGDLGTISVALGQEVLHVPLVHVESFEILEPQGEEEPQHDPRPGAQRMQRALLDAATTPLPEEPAVAPEPSQPPPRRGPGRPRAHRTFPTL